MIKKILGVLLGLLIVLLAYAYWFGSAISFDQPALQPPQAQARVQSPPLTSAKQILFGDLHVHTSFSMDAALFGTPSSKGTGYYAPADACDFARYCSQLDFWSINDHAEGLAPWQWRDTRTAVAQCNAMTDPANPDMVTFLGWEWSQSGNTPADHYGHKNVILRYSEGATVPPRPIASKPSLWRYLGDSNVLLRGLGLAYMAGTQVDEYAYMAKHLQTVDAMPDCSSDDINSANPDCFEAVSTAEELFQRLDQLEVEALVIPHGLAWGTTNPQGADFSTQLEQHNPDYQRLLEVYSGHGNSEIFRDIDQAVPKQSSCPAPRNGYMACCWKAGEIIRQRCEQPGSEACEQSVAQARQWYAEADTGMPIGNPKSVVPDTVPEDWGSCDQLTNAFQPAYNYQPKNTAQYMLSLPPNSRGERLNLGFIASGDNHSARPGTGYKEVDRFTMTDTKDSGISPPPPKSPPASQPRQPGLMAKWLNRDSADAFYYTGGLVAVHSQGRDQQAVYDALYRREVYATSGPRIGLWFDLLQADGQLHPMGSEVWSVPNPQFVVRALGSPKQQPGCPDYASQAMGQQRIDQLCRGECFNPTGELHVIDRIEVVRVQPALAEDEAVTGRIDDPWRSFACGETECEVRFTDPDFGPQGRNVSYYVRAIQAATPTINGDPLRCELDSNGQCDRAQLCQGKDRSADCLDMAEQRAWSSPIYVRWAGE